MNPRPPVNVIRTPQRRLWGLLILLPAISLSLIIPAMSDEPVAPATTYSLVITKAGYFMLVQDDVGNPSFVKITNVIQLDKPTDPIPPPVGGLKAIVKQATEEVTDPNKANAKKALALLYRQVASLPAQTPSQLREATDTLFNSPILELHASWKVWKTKVDAALYSGDDIAKARSEWIIIAEVLETP